MIYDRSTLGRILRNLFRPGRFSLKNTFYTLALLGVLTAIFVGVRVMQWIDEILFPQLRTTEVSAPIFIVANPRSGTTFLHRMMALDHEQFTYMRLWQTILPSVTLYRLIERASRIDRAMKRPFGRLLQRFERAAFRGWDGVHHVGFDRAEEDEWVFLNALMDPAILMLVRHPHEFQDLEFLDRLPEQRRHFVMKRYKRALRAHIFATGNHRILLSKNVFHMGRLEALVEAFPDARFVYLIRNPCDSLASSISMFTTPWSLFMPPLPKDSPEYRYWADLGMTYYDYVHHLTPRLKARGVPFLTIKFDELVRDPKGTVEHIYDTFDIPMSPEFAQRLIDETSKSRRYKSTHHYDLETYGLEARDIYNRIPEVFDAHGFEGQGNGAA